MSVRSHPPRVAAWLVEHLLPSGYEAVAGDLEEEFHDHVAAYGPRKAALLYWNDVLRSLPVYLITITLWSIVMLRNYLKITLRTLARYKSFSAINIMGLAISMAVCLVILLFIRDQKSYDRFHADSDRIYRIYSDFKSPSNNTNNLYATSPASLAEVLRAEYPVVAEAVRMVRIRREAIANDKLLPVRGVYAEPSFFDVFGFTLAIGDPEQALDRPYTIVLSEDTAARFFGEDDPMGQTVMLQDTLAFTVTGVLKEPPGKTHLDPDVLVSFATLASTERGSGFLANWQSNIYTSYTYFRLREEASPSALTAQFPDIIARHYEAANDARLYALNLQAVTDINLGQQMGNQMGPVTEANTVYFLGALALIIMLTACFNYVSLSIARALKRGKEVGIRKVVGAHRGQVVRQFLTEAVLLAFLALGVAVLLLFWLLPTFNGMQMPGAAVVLRPSDVMVYLVFIGFAVLVGIGAGLYPALYLSAFAPVRVLKGQAMGKGRSRFSLRKGLTVVQFAVSLVFIITTAMLYKQFTHTMNTDYGFNEEQVVNVALEDVPYEVFRTEMLNHPDIVNVSAMTPLPGSGSRWDTWIRTEAMTDRIKGYSVVIDEHTLDNLDMTLLAGRNFSPQFPSDRTQAVILNETALRELGLGTPQQAINQTIITDDSTQVQVVGVVQDYRYYSALHEIDPVVLWFDNNFYQDANVRIRAGADAGAVVALEQVWGKLGSLRPLDYAFFEAQLVDSYDVQDLKQQMGIIGLAALFAIFIACLGLLGMAAYSAEVRIKEVGIRRAMGASVGSIVWLLSSDFLKLIAVAVVLAVPAAWFFNQSWLQDLGNRAVLGPGVFIVSIVALLVLALVTIGSQTFRAARISPVESLRDE